MHSRFMIWGATCFMGMMLGMGSLCQAEWMAEGIKLVPLTDNGKSRAVAWAYHGDLVTYVYEISDTQRQLMIMKSDGTDPVKVSPIGYPFFAEWSWRGDKLSYEFANAADEESQAQVYVYDVATRKSVAISAPYPRENMDPDDGPFWSADDRHVAFQVRTGPAKTPQLWVANPETGQSWLVLPERKLQDHRWSPTDPTRLVALIDSAGNGYDAATFRMDGRELTMLTDIGAQEVYTDRPRWSPDGKWIVLKNDQIQLRS